MRICIKCIAFFSAIITISTASAIPELLDGFNFKYETSGTRLDSCELCHLPEESNANACGSCHAVPVFEKGRNLNPYGNDLEKNLYKMNLDKAFSGLESLDSDNDGIPNKDEINEKSYPGDKIDKPKKNVISSFIIMIGR